jgi:hypothetical protein
VVFIIDLAGNSIGFGSRFLGALMSAIVFALVFGALVYFGYGNGMKEREINCGISAGLNGNKGKRTLAPSVVTLSPWPV